MIWTLLIFKERRQSPETQYLDHYHPIAPLPRSDIGPFLFTVCYSTWTRPLSVPPPTGWPRLLLSQTFLYKYPSNLVPAIPTVSVGIISVTFQGSVTKPNYAVNAGMAKQAEGRQLARKGKSPLSLSSLFGWFPATLLVCMTYEDGTECSEMSVHKNSDAGLSPNRKNTKILVMFIIIPVSCKKQKTQ